MTREEVLNLIDSEIVSQGNQVGAGSALGAVLKEIVNNVSFPVNLPSGVILFAEGSPMGYPLKHNTEADEGEYYAWENEEAGIIVYSRGVPSAGDTVYMKDEGTGEMQPLEDIPVFAAVCYSDGDNDGYAGIGFFYDEGSYSMVRASIFDNPNGKGKYAWYSDIMGACIYSDSKTPSVGDELYGMTADGSSFTTNNIHISSVEE